MEFFKMKKFTRGRKPTPKGDDAEDKDGIQQQEPTKDDNNVNGLDKSSDANVETEDDDDDFITNEVKRRLKELRRNSFMALIPEEDSSPEDDDEEDREEEGETSSSEGRDVEALSCQKFWSGFDALYDRYCEQMLFFDRLSAQQLQEVSLAVPTPSPRSQSKKLTSTFRCLSLKKVKEPEDEMEHLQQPERDPYQDLETAYVAQLCMTWETLHSQYTQMNQKISYQPENSTSYSHTAQQFQQFQVLLQRFIENEPFEQGLRPEVYTRTRNSLPKLLQVPKIEGSDQNIPEEEESDWVVLAPTLLNVIESSILTFQQFLKIDKKKSGNVRKIFASQNHHGSTPLQQVQSSLEKKSMKLKEHRKKSRSWRKNTWPSVREDVELLLSSIDVKVISRVLRMVWISKEQLFWCEEKMKKINFPDGKLQRDPSPILFPC